MIVVQQIRTTWWKSARGAPQASKRNQISEVAILPTDKATIKKDDNALEHLLYYDEHKDFSDPSQSISSLKYEIGEPVRLGCVKLHLKEELLEVIWCYDAGYIGAPARDGRHKTVFCLTPQSWGQVRYNGRLSREETWEYRKVVLNVGLFADVKPDLFCSTPPNFSYHEMAKLF